MKVARFLYGNIWNNATTRVVDAFSAIPALPATASQNPDRTYVWRSTTTTGDQWLRLSTGPVGLGATCVAVANMRLHGSGGTAKLQSTTDPTGATGWADVAGASIAAQDGDSRTSFKFFTSPGVRIMWRIYFTNVGAVSDYVEVGYVFLGDYYEPDVNVTDGLNMDQVDPSVGVMSVDGQETFTIRTRYTTGTMEFEAVSASTLALFQTMWRTIGATTPFFLVLDADQTWTCWYGRLVDRIQRQFREGSATLYNVSMEFREAR